MWWLYFVVGDLLTCTVAGAAAGWLVQAVVSTDWFLAVGMAAGMGLGMLAGVVGGALFTPLFGALEVMLPAALSGMVAGMGAGMAQTLTQGPGANVYGGLGGSEAALGGALAGLACLVFTYLLQALVGGEVRRRAPKS
jgi:hypothetical protein